LTRPPRLAPDKLKTNEQKPGRKKPVRLFESKIAAAARYLAGNVPEICLISSSLIPQLLIPVNLDLAYISTFP